jgi:hemerythrin-like domain-containing protein
LKRAEALRSLSRDHHVALTVAQRLRRAEDAAAGAASFLEFWEEHGERHFRLEEEVLLPRWGLLGTVDADAAARLAQEHLRIRIAAIAVRAGTPALEQVRELGDRLHEHVRFEERELFPAIEADLGDEKLSRLARAFEEAERAS